MKFYIFSSVTQTLRRREDLCVSERSTEILCPQYHSLIRTLGWEYLVLVYLLDDKLWLSVWELCLLWLLLWGMGLAFCASVAREVIISLALFQNLWVFVGLVLLMCFGINRWPAATVDDSWYYLLCCGINTPQVMLSLAHFWTDEIVLGSHRKQFWVISLLLYWFCHRWLDVCVFLTLWYGCILGLTLSQKQHGWNS